MVTSEAVGPIPPLTELTAMAVQIHELYETYVEAGFTTDQSFELVKLSVFTVVRES